MKRVLIVDDDPAIVDGLLELLADNYEVAGAMDGAEALARLEAGGVDLVLLDLMMPIMDGATLKREMDARGIRVPVLIMSADRDLRSLAQELAAADWLAKPFDIDELEDRIARLLGGRGGDAPAGGGGGRPPSAVA